MIIKDFKEIICLGQEDNVKTYINKAINKFIDGSEKEVVTSICFTDSENNIIYKYSQYNSYICLLEDNEEWFNLNMFLEDLVRFINYKEMDRFYKDKLITKVLENNFTALKTIKRFKKEYFEEVENKIKAEKRSEIQDLINIKVEEIEAVKNEILGNYKDQIRINTPNKNNDYHYELLTKDKYIKIQAFNNWNDSEELNKFNDILLFFKDFYKSEVI